MYHGSAYKLNQAFVHGLNMFTCSLVTLMIHCLCQEPHMEVLTPTSKSVQNYVGNRLLVYLYREFREKEKPGVITPHVRADDVISQFPSLTEGFIRKRLKHCADLQVRFFDL